MCMFVMPTLFTQYFEKGSLDRSPMWCVCAPFYCKCEHLLSLVELEGYLGSTGVKLSKPCKDDNFKKERCHIKYVGEPQ